MLKRFWNTKFWGAGVIVFIMCTASASVVADDSDWIQVGIARDGSTFDLKKRSAEFVTLGDNAPAISAVERYSNSTSKITTFIKVYVRVSDCAQGLGKLVNVDFDGVVQGKVDWVSGGGTIGSIVAKFLCDVAKEMATDQANDSIKGRYIDNPVNAPSKK